MASKERESGVAIFAVGLGAIAFAVVSGLTKTSNGETTADWIGIITLIAGVIVMLTGLFVAWHDGGHGRTLTGGTPHSAS
jgi:fatty acid desaturase